MVDLRKELSLSDLIPKLPAKKPTPVSAASTKRRAMPPEVIGLKIEAGSITAAHVLNNGGKKLLQVARSPLAPGVVGGGEVRDPAGLAAAINDFFAEHDLPRRGVRLGLANSRIGVRVIEITGVTDLTQLENAIGFRAHEILSVPLDEALLDYHVLASTTGEDGAVTYRILLVVAYRDSVDRYLAATDAAGVEVAGIDLDAFALLRAIAQPGTDPAAEPIATAAVAIDHDLTTLAISDGTACHFTRVLEWGTANVDTALCRALKITAEQAAEIRKELSLEGAPVPYGGGSPGIAPQPADVVRRELLVLQRELVSSIRFYLSQEGSVPVRGLIVSSSLVDVPGLVDRLSSDLGILVTAADPFVRIDADEDVERPETSGGLVVAVGLGLED